MSDLIAILQHIQKRPEMYFGDRERSRSIYILRAFIIGFQLGEGHSNEHRNLDFFTEWVAMHYRVLAEGRDSFHMILERVGSDEHKAYDEFFRLLPDFLQAKQELGRDGILSKFCEVQDECMEAFRKDLENQ